MTISHHLDDSTLMSFAAGSLPEALAVVAAAHVESCPQCARELRNMEQIGAAMFAGLKPAALMKSAPVATLVRGEDTVEVNAIKVRSSDLPSALAKMVGPDISTISWKRLGIGVWQHKLALSGGNEGDLRLLKISPGRRMPDHGHGGSELTMILDGAYTDKTGTYRTGDVADLGDDLEHRPVADAELGCICVVATEQPARFKAMIQKMIQPLTGM
jgi:putative transcriptional regulator